MRLNRSSSNRVRTFIESTSTNDFEHEYEHQHERDMDTYDEAFGRYTIGKLFPFPLYLGVFLSRNILELATLDRLYSPIKHITTACILVYDLLIQHIKMGVG